MPTPEATARLTRLEFWLSLNMPTEWIEDELDTALVGLIGLTERNARPDLSHRLRVRNRDRRRHAA